MKAFLPEAPEAFTYDDDGNLTSDGRWYYYYDAENRLIWLQTHSAAVAAGHPYLAFHIFYDYLGRRVIKHPYLWNGSAWATNGAQERYLYNGWNLIARLDDMALTKNMFWGLDLSGTAQGAGGIGGLLMVQEGGESYLPAYDALGNVHAMIKASDGSIAAAYEYDAYGRTLRESGPYAAANPFRFSTKYTDNETGLVYHDTRYYSPSLGRFINRDSIGEQGGFNLYAYVNNRVPNAVDKHGKAPIAIAPVVISALVKPALFAATVDIGIQLYKNGGDWSNINISSVVTASTIGVLGYGLPGYLGKTILHAKTLKVASDPALKSISSVVNGSLVRTPATSYIRQELIETSTNAMIRNASVSASWQISKVSFSAIEDHLRNGYESEGYGNSNADVTYLPKYVVSTPRFSELEVAVANGRVKFFSKLDCERDYLGSEEWKNAHTNPNHWKLSVLQSLAFDAAIDARLGIGSEHAPALQASAEAAMSAYNMAKDRLEAIEENQRIQADQAR